MTVRTLTTKPAATSSLKRLIIRHPLLAFFTLAFAISWSFLIADALGSRGIIPFRLTLSGPGIILALLMSYGPTFAALIVAWATGGAAEVRTLLGRLVPWRAGLRWYVLALVGPAILGLTSGILRDQLGATLQPLPGPVYQIVLMGLVGSILHAIANGEEFGWRGYALPYLQTRYSALSASLILGVIWAIFHLPIMFTIGGVGGSQTWDNALPFLLGTLMLSIIITWIFNSTHGSVLPIILLHGALNTWMDMFATQGGNPALVWVEQLPTLLIAATLVLVFGPKYLSRTPATKRSEESESPKA